MKNPHPLGKTKIKTIRRRVNKNPPKNTCNRSQFCVPGSGLVVFVDLA